MKLKAKNMLLGLMLVSSLAQAQSSNEIEKPFVVKTNLTGDLFGNYNVQGEYALGKHTSVALQLRFMPSRGLSSSASNQVDVDLSNSKLNTFAVTPEFRYYFKEALKGFYVAPYLRYRTIGLKFPLDYVDGAGNTQFIDTKAKYNMFGIGLLAGSQFRLTESLTLDWYIIGGHYSSSKIKSSQSFSQTLSASDIAEIEADLAEINDSGFPIQYTVSANKIDVSSSSFGSFGIRAAGICLGYRF